MRNANKPSTPVPYMKIYNGNGTLECEHTGLTKREMFAIKIMAAYRSQNETMEVKSEEVAKWAIEDADSLLKRLGK